MAVALTPGAHLSRTGTAWGVWFSWFGRRRIDVDRGVPFTILAYLGNSSVGGGGFQFTLDSTRKLIVYDCRGGFPDLLAGAGPIIPVGEWWDFAITTIEASEANGIRIYYAPRTAPAFTEVVATYLGAYEYDIHGVGARPGTDGQDNAYRLHGSAEHDRSWQNVTLTPTELERERRSVAAVRAGGLWSDWRMRDAASATTDWAGSARSLTQTLDGGTVTTTDGPLVDEAIDVRWEPGDETRFRQNVLSVDGTQVYALDTATGRGRFQAVAGTGIHQSNRREAWTLPGTEDLDEHIRTTWYSGDAFGSVPDLGPQTINPQHGVAFRVGDDGVRRSIITVDNNIFFGAQWTPNASVWSALLDGTGFVNRQSGMAFESLIQQGTITSIARAANVVTATVTGAPSWYVGDRVNPNVFFTPSFNTPVVVSTVSRAGDVWTLTWPQTGADETGDVTPPASLTKVFPYDFEARMNPPGGSIVEVRARRIDQAEFPDWVAYDPTAGLHAPSVPSGTILSTPDHASLDIVGDLTIQAELTLPDWNPAVGNDPICAKRSSTAGQASWLFTMENGAPAGRLRLFWSANGSTLLDAISTVPVAFTDGQQGAVAVQIDVDNGAAGRTIRFYTAPSIDGPWTQLGADVVQAGVTSIFNSTSPVEIGSQQGGSNAFRRLQAGARVHACKIRAAANFTAAPVVDYFGPNLYTGQTSFTCRAGRAFTVAAPGEIVNGGMPEPPATALRYAVDLDQAGSEANIAANPTPTNTSRPMGLVAAHLGTDDRSAVVFGRTTFGAFTAHDLSAAVNAVDDFAGDLSLEMGSIIELSGSIDAIGDMTGRIGLRQPVAGSMDAAGDWAGSVVAHHALAGNMDAAGDLTGVLSLARMLELSGSIDAVGELDGALNVRSENVNDTNALIGPPILRDRATIGPPRSIAAATIALARLAWAIGEVRSRAAATAGALVHRDRATVAAARSRAQATAAEPRTSTSIDAPRIERKD